jgi:nucleoid-associated protein YgaU
MAATQQGAPLKTVTVAGGNLFAIALQVLGDATQWNRIAQQNGMTDPWFTGVVTLAIPPTNSAAGGGVYGT